uniref:MARVEL domain-containing protein n=1 Tax=Tetranychus urticae TaxID=32264 RepID=T1KFU2_TETUR
MDDDIYSLERLRPAPPKPPKSTNVKTTSSIKERNNKSSIGVDSMVSTSPVGATPPVGATVSSHRQLASLQSLTGSVLTQQSSSTSSQQLLLERSLSLQETPSQGLVNGKKQVTSRLQSNPITDSENRLATLLERDSFGPRALNDSATVSSSIEMGGLISATSSSLLHGIILLLIMLASLAAFVASKLADPCEDFYLSDNLECSTLTAICFSAVNILSCLYTFTIYFLHLIGQCDYISWSARRKVAAEIICTLGMISALVASIFALYTKTIALQNLVCVVASAFSIITILLYVLRSGLLLREIRMLWSKPLPSRQSSKISRKTSVVNSNQEGTSNNTGSKKWSTSRGSFSRASVSSASAHQHKSQSQSIKVKRENNQINNVPVNPSNQVGQEQETELEDDHPNQDGFSRLNETDFRPESVLMESAL